MALSPNTAGRLDSIAYGHISVCICTFKRSTLLLRLLQALDRQVTHGRFVFSIVVVDNDRGESARRAVEVFEASSKTKVKYCVEPEQNISSARNRAVALADSELIAFIDDDEVPGEKWLIRLVETLHVHEAQGVLGPVKPNFQVSPPNWVLRGKFCERPSYTTGTVLRKARQTRTGNALLRRGILTEEKPPFEPLFGRTGGEDVDFFRRRLQKGDYFVWCNEAPVFENVPPARMTRSYFLRRALLRGVANAERVPLLSMNVAKSVVAILLYTTALPMLLLWRHDIFMNFLARDCDHIGKVFAASGLKLVRKRSPA